MKHGLTKAEVTFSALELTRKLYAENREDLELYLDLLLEWNQKINLVSRTVSRETLREHVVHSLLPLSLGLTQKHKRWIDAGSGGGLPGIPLAICERKTLWSINDNVKKKMKAVADIIERMEMNNTEVLAHSISLVKMQKGTGIVTKHAFKIEDLLRHLGTKPWKTILMWKGAEHAEEELRRSKKKLNCTLYEFNFGKGELFYEGKGILKIER